MNNRKIIDNGSVKRSGKNNRLNLRVDNEVLAILNTISFEDDETMSQVVRKAVKQYDMLRKNKNRF